MEQHDHSTGPRSLTCTVVTPETTVLDTQASFVALPLFDGEIGIAPAHAPMIGRLGFGEMRVEIGDKVERYYVDGGFVQVVGDTVAVLTPRAIPFNKLDPEVAAEQLAAARARPANSEEQLAIRERLEQQARAMLHVAEKVD
jgi:F-type H+-transporting ATPase subunit epsilon